MSPNLVKNSPIHLIDILIVNESELQSLADQMENIDQASQASDKGLDVLDKLAIDIHQTFKLKILVLTKGSAGAFAVIKDSVSNSLATISLPAAPVGKDQVKDTTAAGDTWAGYFLATIISRQESPNDLTKNMVMDAMMTANHASGIGVTRHGAIPSIPF